MDEDGKKTDDLGDVVVKLDALSHLPGLMVQMTIAQAKAEIRGLRAERTALLRCEEALRWFINDIDGTHTVMLDFDANVELARAALTLLDEARHGK